MKPLAEVAALFGKGAAKYGDHNFRKGYPWSWSYAALQRHCLKFWSGEDVDPELQLHHLAAVCFHALALMQFAIDHPEFDDRQ